MSEPRKWTSEDEVHAKLSILDIVHKPLHNHEKVK